MMKSEKKHDKCLEKLLTNPDIIIVKKPIITSAEIRFIDEYGKLVSKPDFMAYDGELYLLEYKNSEKRRDKAIAQLQKSLNFIRNNLHYKDKIHTLFACKNLREIERLHIEKYKR